MPVRIDMQLSSSAELNVQMSSLFHGLLMERLNNFPQLQDQLHLSLLHPYSQHLVHHDDAWHWIICFTDDELFQRMWEEGLSRQKNFCLKHNGIRIEIENTQITALSFSDLNSAAVNEESPYKFRLSFLTPTAFKSNGRYIYMPDLAFIYSSIMRKFDAVAGNVSIYDEETLDQLCRSTFIQDYRLRTTRFALEGVKIHAFIGNIVINAKSNRTMAAFLNMLMSFAEFSGVGIKTALGMGAVAVEKIK